MVVLARALFRKPRLLLLDESMSAMDRKTEAFVLNLLEKEKHERMTIMVTHRMATAEKCDRIVILEEGKIAAYGSPRQLKAFPNFFSESLQKVY